MQFWVSNGSGNNLLIGDTKPSPEPVMAYRQFDTCNMFYWNFIQIQIQKVFIDSQYMVQQLEQQTPVCH